MSDGDFLSRWSRRKLAAKAGRVEPEPLKPVVPAPDKSIRGQAPAGIQGSPAPFPDPPLDPRPPVEDSGGRLRGDDAPPLPAVESLTSESDFTPFMQPNVDGALRRAALKTLFQDPRFNVMDGLDVYIDDYTKADPLPEGWLEKMNQVAHLGHYQPPPEPGSTPDAAVAAAAQVGSLGESEAEPPIETPADSESKQDSVNPASEPHSRS